MCKKSQKIVKKLLTLEKQNDILYEQPREMRIIAHDCGGNDL